MFRTKWLYDGLGPYDPQLGAIPDPVGVPIRKERKLKGPTFYFLQGAHFCDLPFVGNVSALDVRGKGQPSICPLIAIWPGHLNHRVAIKHDDSMSQD
jgi:hypothetical protein